MPDDTTPAPAKPGYKTTEFWLSLAASTIGALMMSDVIAEGSTVAKIVGGIATILSTLGYTVSRAKLKAAP